MKLETPNIDYILKYRYIEHENKYIETNIITEDIYRFELFIKLNTYILNNLFREHKPYVYLTGEEIKNYLPKNWNGLKYIKSNKNVYIFDEDFENPTVFNYIKFTEEEKQKLSNKLKSNTTKGEFITNLTYLKITDSIILINKDISIEFAEGYNTLSHEFIHYFQWNSGRSIYNIKQTNMFDISDISDNELQEISECLKLNNLDETKYLITHLINKDEYVTISQEIFENLFICSNYDYNICNLLTHSIFGCLDKSYNKKYSFKQFYDNIQFNLHRENRVVVLLDLNIFKFDIRELILYKWFGIGYNTIKNHIYSYLNQQKKK